METRQRGVFTRIRERVRYGLLTQEMVDALHRKFRILIVPYFVVLEGTDPGARPPETDERIDCRFLERSDLPQVAAIRTQATTLARLERILEHSRCLGIFVDGRLAGYTWSRDDEIPVPVTGQTLVELAPDEALLFDAFVAREFRGLNLAPVVRDALYRELAKLGRTRLYSVTMAFNRSSRRFKRKLGAQEIELRLLLGIRGSRALDVRLRRLGGTARGPRALRLHGSPGQYQAA